MALEMRFATSDGVLNQVTSSCMTSFGREMILIDFGPAILEEGTRGGVFPQASNVRTKLKSDRRS